MKKFFTLALVMAVLSVGGIVLANDGACPAGADKAAKAAKGGKHAKVDINKELADLEAQKAELVKADAKADTKELDAKIEAIKAKIAKKAEKKAAKNADKKAAAAAPAAQ